MNLLPDVLVKTGLLVNTWWKKHTEGTQNRSVLISKRQLEIAKSRDARQITLKVGLWQPDVRTEISAEKR
jgi:hypothetical protein